jgi:circadian clock protein KaiB
VVAKDVLMEKHLLTLYVTGQTPRSQRAIANLRSLCDQELKGRYELTVIDVLEHPQLAEDQKILATPTVIRELPPPIRRIIGDLSDSERVLLGLDLQRLVAEAQADESAESPEEGGDQ